MAYAKLKRQWTEAVWAEARAAGLHKGGPFEGPARLRFEWRERDRRRDPDGVSAGGKKLVLDGLVMAKVLAGDGWKHIAGWEDSWSVDADQPGVMVTIWNDDETTTDGRKAP
jgi:hypothetical protein